MKAGLGALIWIGVAAAVCSAGLYCKENLVDASRVVVAVCEPEQTQPTDGLSLPASIEGTDLVVESLNSYEGPYLEDGTYEEVVDVAALAVRNGSSQTMEHVSVTVNTGRRLLRFEGSWLPPGSACVLLEKNRQTLLGERAVNCEGTQRITTQENLLCSAITLRELGDISLCVVNNTSERLDAVLLRYKTYLQQTDMLMGGVTNELYLEKLDPGEEYCVTPPYYVKDYSKVVFVQWDE